MQQDTKIGCALFSGIGCLVMLAFIALAMIGAWFVTYTSIELGHRLPGMDHEQTEVIGNDGISQGFVIDPNSVSQSTDYAYQIGAYVRGVDSKTAEPAFRAAIDYSHIEPFKNADDVGSLWVGSALKNDYFIQLGMMTSQNKDDDGSMQWNYFWEMWDDQDRYVAGLMQPMSDFGWNQNASNTFALTCTDPATGEWQFTVNDQVVGKTYTKSCAVSIRNTYLFWELTTPTTEPNQLPVFGSFTFHDFTFWDGYNWLAVPQTELSYSHGPVSTSTSFNQAAVCPPYGAATSVDARLFQVGSGLDCLPAGTQLW